MRHAEIIRVSVLLAALAFIATAGTAHAATRLDDKDLIAVTGCVLPANGGTLLTDTAGPDAAALERRTDQPAIYWLGDDHEVRKEAGHRVEVIGKVKRTLDKGEIDAKRKGDVVELRLKSEGHELKAMLPAAETPIGTSGSVTEVKEKFDFLVRRIDVKTARPLPGHCGL